MTIDTQKLAESMKLVMTFNVLDTDNEREYLMGCEKMLYQARTIMRQQGEVMRELHEALTLYKKWEEVCNVSDGAASKALALSAPLVKKEGDL